MSATMASVMELFGKESEPVTARLVEVTLVAVKLEIVVLPKLVMPVTTKLVEVILVAKRLTKTVFVANISVEVTYVKTAVEAPVLPIGVLLIDPPSIVRPLTTIASVIELAGKDRVLVTVKLPIVARGITAEEPKKLVEVILIARIFVGLKAPVTERLVKLAVVAKIFVEVILVPVAEVKPKAPDNVPPVKSR